MTFQVTFEGVEAKTRKVQVVWLPRAVEQGENVAQLLDMLRRYSLDGPPLIQRFKPAVSE